MAARPSVGTAPPPPRTKSNPLSTENVAAMTNTHTIENLAAALRISEERERTTAAEAAESARKAAAEAAAREDKIARLTTFLKDVGVDPEIVLEGYWMHHAAKLLRISIDESDDNLSHVPDQERASIITVARRLMAAGAKG